MRARWLIPCAMLGVYLYTFPFFDELKSANEYPRIFLTTEIVDRGTFAIDGRLDELGSRYDVATTPDGRHFSNKAPGLSFLAVPSYLLVKAWHGVAGGEPSLRELTWMFRFTAVTVPAVLFLPLFLAMARRFAPDAEHAPRTALAAYALGSLALPYAILFFSHQTAAVLCGASFACSCMLSRGDRMRHPDRFAVLCGLCAGLAVLVDYQAAIAALAVGIHLMMRAPRRVRHALLAAAGAAPAAVLLALYHAACFGSPLRTGYSFAVDPAHTRGVLGIIGPNGEALYNATIAPDNGLLFLSPWVVLAVVGFVAIWRDPDARARVGAEAITCAAIALLYVLFVGSLVPEFGRAGWSVGPRYLGAALPFVAWLAAAGIAAVDRHAAARVAAGALVWFGIAAFTLAAATFPHWLTPHFTNPLHSISLRLVGEGMAPPSLGTAVGLPGAAAYVPLFAGVAALAGWLMAGRDRTRWIHAGIAAAIAAALLALTALIPERGALAERGWHYIEQIWP